MLIFFKKIISKLRQYFVSGFMLMLPIFLTFWVLLILFRISDGFLGDFINNYLAQQYGYRIPGLGILIMLILIISAGVLATNVVARRFFPEIERWLLKFPLVRNIYPPAKQLSEFIFTHKNQSGFKKTVLIEFPRKGSYTFGFITNAEIEVEAFTNDRKFYSIFVPNVPNPLTGFLLLLPKEELIFLDIGIDQALKLIVSGGVVSPKIFKNLKGDVNEQ